MKVEVWDVVDKGKYWGSCYSVFSLLRFSTSASSNQVLLLAMLISSYENGNFHFQASTASYTYMYASLAGSYMCILHR